MRITCARLYETGLPFSIDFLKMRNFIALRGLHMKFGEKLKELRARKNASQRDAAKAVGISPRTYQGYEQEGRHPKKREVYGRLAAFFGCDVNYLLTEDEAFVADAAAKYGVQRNQQAEQLVQEIAGLFSGGDLAEDDRDEIMRAIQEAYWKAKEKNRKYAPDRYRSGE